MFRNFAMHQRVRWAGVGNLPRKSRDSPPVHSLMPLLTTMYTLLLVSPHFLSYTLMHASHLSKLYGLFKLESLQSRSVLSGYPSPRPASPCTGRSGSGIPAEGLWWLYRPTSVNVYSTWYVIVDMCMCKHAHLYRSASAAGWLTL